MNIKYLPSHYILKRWTREARSGSIQDSHGNIILEDPRMEDRLRLKFLIHKFYGIASQAVLSEECSKLVDDALESLSKQVEDKAPNTTCRTEAIFEEPDDILQAACLKKKEVEKKKSRRQKSWLEKQHPNKKKRGTTEVLSKKQSRSVNFLAPIKRTMYVLMKIQTNSLSDVLFREDPRRTCQQHTTKQLQSNRLDRLRMFCKNMDGWLIY